MRLSFTSGPSDGRRRVRLRRPATIDHCRLYLCPLCLCRRPPRLTAAITTPCHWQYFPRCPNLPPFSLGGGGGGGHETGDYAYGPPARPPFLVRPSLSYLTLLCSVPMIAHMMGRARPKVSLSDCHCIEIEFCDAASSSQRATGDSSPHMHMCHDDDDQGKGGQVESQTTLVVVGYRHDRSCAP